MKFNQIYLGTYHVMRHATFCASNTGTQRRQVMRLLIQHGADVNLRDSMGYSAADIIFNRSGFPWSGEVNLTVGWVWFGFLGNTGCGFPNVFSPKRIQQEARC